ncbi:MAG: hypothetical protein NTY98_09935 [Verrucomicrobia bacterium]|nr:hypothetical protein [Verrucomicrobiota bacterium]
MRNTYVLIFTLLTSGRITAQEFNSKSAETASVQPVFSVLFESTVKHRDGSIITFRQVAPPVVTPLPQPAPPAAGPVLTAAEEAALSQMPMKDFKVLSISASVHANGFTVLRWTCGESRRLQAVSNVDFRFLTGLGNFASEQADYHLILSAGPDEQAMTDAEVLVAQSLPVNGSASCALLSGSTPAGPADESALDAMESLLEYFDTHREELIQRQAQREQERAARELAALHAPPPPPRHSIVHFWPLQPAQRAAIETSQRGKGAAQP